MTLCRNSWISIAVYIALVAALTGAAFRFVVLPRGLDLWGGLALMWAPGIAAMITQLSSRRPHQRP